MSNRQQNESTGAHWCRRRDEKKRKASRTAGKEKKNCHASPQDKFMTSRERSYKHPEYIAWCKKMAKQVSDY